MILEFESDALPEASVTAGCGLYMAVEIAGLLPSSICSVGDPTVVGLDSLSVVVEGARVLWAALRTVIHCFPSVVVILNAACRGKL